MLIRNYPPLVTVAIWFTAGLYGIYWAVQNAFWIKRIESNLKIERKNPIKIIRNIFAIYFGYHILVVISDALGYHFLFDLQDLVPAMRVVNTFLWFLFLSYMLWEYGTRIREIEGKVGIENKVKISTAFLLVPLLYSSGTYYQRHINEIGKNLNRVSEP